MDTQLVDKIYESCFAPEIWPDVLDEIGQIADAPGASTKFVVVSTVRRIVVGDCCGSNSPLLLTSCTKRMCAELMLGARAPTLKRIP